MKTIVAIFVALMLSGCAGMKFILGATYGCASPGVSVGSLVHVPHPTIWGQNQAYLVMRVIEVGPFARFAPDDRANTTCRGALSVPVRMVPA